MKKAPDELNKLLSERVEANFMSQNGTELPAINNKRKRTSQGGRNVLDRLVAGGESADVLLEQVPADILVDCVRALLRNNVAILFSRSRDDDSLVLTLYENGNKRFIIPQGPEDFVTRMEAMLLQLD